MTSVVSRAFQILSDSDKKSKYDRYGGDPDNRFGGGSSSTSSGQSPFSGFARTPSSSARQGQAWGADEEISPEELFNRFFSGGMGGPFGTCSYELLKRILSNVESRWGYV